MGVVLTVVAVVAPFVLKAAVDLFSRCPCTPPPHVEQAMRAMKPENATVPAPTPHLKKALRAKPPIMSAKEMQPTQRSVAQVIRDAQENDFVLHLKYM